MVLLRVIILGTRPTTVFAKQQKSVSDLESMLHMIVKWMQYIVYMFVWTYHMLCTEEGLKT